MATKTITIINEAYDKLKREKDKDESFSDVILRITKKRSKIKDSFGKWKTSNKEIDEISSNIKDAWRRFGNHENTRQ